LTKITTAQKIVSRSELLQLVKIWRKDGETIVFTNGVFDIIHRGHLESFERAAAYADKFIVGVNTDRSARKLAKGLGRPFINEDDRAILVAGFAVVDALVLFDEDTPYELLRTLRPDVLVKGADYKLDDIVGREFAKRVERIDLVEGFSTSSLIKKIISIINRQSSIVNQ